MERNNEHKINTTHFYLGLLFCFSGIRIHRITGKRFSKAGPSTYFQDLDPKKLHNCPASFMPQNGFGWEILREIRSPEYAQRVSELSRNGPLGTDARNSFDTIFGGLEVRERFSWKSNLTRTRILCIQSKPFPAYSVRSPIGARMNRMLLGTFRRRNT